MAINIKNYTTTVSVQKSVDLIRKLLIEFGARDLAEKYNEAGKLVQIRFISEIDGQKLPFALPADITAVFLWLKRNKMKGSKDAIILAQAERIAWKNCYEWLYQQLVQIELGQMEKMEAFLYRFYDVNNNQTFYQRLKESNFQGLLLPTSN